MGTSIEAIGGGGGGMTLLWENPNPSSATSGGTLQLDLSLYDWVLVVTNHSINRTWVYKVTPVLIDGLMYEAVQQASSESNVIVGRTFSATQTKFSYGNGFYVDAVGNVRGSATDCCIPVKLYGVKR